MGMHHTASVYSRERIGVSFPDRIRLVRDMVKEEELRNDAAFASEGRSQKVTVKALALKSL